MHHYKACGLENVWLENGYTIKDTPYGKAVSVIDADGLHKVLAMQIAKKEGRLTGAELRFLRNSMLCSQTTLGRAIGVTDQTVSLWERNEAAPPAAEAVVRMLALEHMAGDGNIRQIIDRMNTVERLVNQKIVARAQDHRWEAAPTEDAGVFA